MVAELTEAVIRTIQDAARKLTGGKRRKFEAQVAINYCQGSPRKAETIFGWGRVTGKAVREALLQNEQTYAREEIPSPRTLRRVMNRLGYRLRRVQKAKPAKKIPETDAIFEHVRLAHAESEQQDDCLRISMDAKAKVKVGEFSRGGKSRGRQAKKAGDHDMNPQATLIPFGILETARSQLFTVFGTSRETSDFIVDCLQLWWDERKTAYPQIRKLQIDLDNGPELASNRTQFIKRMVQFADRNGLTIELVYYPPYHSKYNSVERCWGILEQHWNGAILDSVDTVLSWARSMTWKGVSPIVRLLDKAYEKGVRLSKKSFRSFSRRVQRCDSLPKWSLEIRPVAAE